MQGVEKDYKKKNSFLLVLKYFLKKTITEYVDHVAFFLLLYYFSITEYNNSSVKKTKRIEKQFF